MQAHPLSSPAARIPSTSSPASPRTSPPASSPSPTPSSTPAQLRTRVPLSGKPAPLSSSATPALTSAGLAHDAGNLLAALGLYCDLLSAPGVLRPEHRHYATELSLISNRSSELIRRLLTATSSTGPTSSDPDGIASLSAANRRHRSTRSSEASGRTSNNASDHASTLHDLAPVLQRIAAGVATVSVVCPASLPPLDFSPEIIERITVNLVRNAVEAICSNTYKEPGSTRAASPFCHSEIHVNLAVLSNRLQLTVEDNGPGMPPSIAAAFLQPSPLPRGATRGFGHRIVHQLASASSGQISVRVRPGNGTIVCIKWPIPSQHRAAPHHSAIPSPPPVESVQKGSRTC